MLTSDPLTSQAASRAKPGVSGEGDFCLNLGGRSTNIPGFLKVDLFDGPGVDIRTDVSNLSMFSDGSVKEIYASHILEHFPHPKTLDVLTEWRRVLVPRGTLWISVPDFDACVRLYQAYGMTEFIRNLLYGDQEYDLAFHYTAFTFPTLANLCAKAGFEDAQKIEHMPYGLSDCSTNIDTATRKPISINLKATA